MTPVLDFVPRPRRPFEALDLGLSLLQAHWGAVMGVFALQVGILLALILPFAWRQPVWVLVFLWWLSPWLGRGVLHVLSRKVFGQEAGVMTFLRHWREIHQSGLLASLLWRRLSPAGSFLLPVWQLEHQRGDAYRQRSRVLLRQSMGAAFLLAVTCLVFEGLALLGSLGILQMMVPRGMPMNLLEELGRGFDRPWFAWVFTALGLLAFALVEPFFSAAGFALYLNRRTVLEGWDLERTFRSLAERLRASARVVLLLCFVALGAVAQEPPQAQTPAPVVEEKPEIQPLRPEDPARRQVEELLASDPDFARTKVVKTYRYHPTGKEPHWLRAILDTLFGERKAPKPQSEPPKIPNWLGPVAWVVKLLLVASLVALVLFLIYRFRNAWTGPAPKGEDYVPPEALAGLDIRPESLPPDVAGEALIRFRTGDPRGALALLYRGALAALIHGHHLEIAASATEGDCLRATSNLSAELNAAFEELTAAWVRAAYLGEGPDDEHIEGLCRRWRGAFGAQASGSAP